MFKKFLKLESTIVTRKQPYEG